MTKVFRVRFTAGLAVAVAMLATGCGGSAPESAEQAGPTDPPATTASPGAPADQGAADALYFYPPVEGAQLSFTATGPGGEVGTDVTVVNVDGATGAQTITVDQVINGTAGALSGEAGFTTDEDGSLQIDTETFMLSMAAGSLTPDMTVEASGDDLVIPAIADLEAGATARGAASVEMSGDGFSLRNDTTFTVSGAGYEAVTVPLGTFDAYVVEVELQTESSMGVSSDGTIRYWFVPGFARVRQETTIAGQAMLDELVSSTVNA